MQQSLWERVLDGSLMPHGYCLLWRWDLIFLHLGGDVLTVLAYFTIPAALVHTVWKRRDMSFDGVFFMFALFILLCGITHAISILNMWQGYYFIEGVFKLSTGLVSATTAIVVWRLVPAALAIPSQQRLKDKVIALEAAERELEKINEQLEEKVRERTQQLERIAQTDELTGLYNRREMMRRLRDELARAGRYGRPLAVMLIDLDHFKSINDSAGHSGGDAVLRSFAGLALRCTRDSDSVGRFGGEEFLVLLPDTEAAGALELAERLRVVTESEVISINGVRIPVTCSIGVAAAWPGEGAEGLLGRADSAMYSAKRAGRNRVRQGLASSPEQRGVAL